MSRIQFDLEQEIMDCWDVTGELNLLLEELVESDTFSRDDASNFVLGLSTIYEAKFNKLFRTFESFLKEYYRVKNEVNDLKDQVEDLREALPTEQDLEDMREDFRQSLDQLYDEEEEQLRLLDENDQLAFIEDEEAPI